MVLKVMLTGSRGIIGRVLSTNLSDLSGSTSMEIYGVDKDEKEGDKNYRADISSYSQLSNVFHLIGSLDCIVHLAADASTEAEWYSVLQNNIVGTRNVYQCARRYGVHKVVFASSNHVTGGYEGIPPVLHKQQNPDLITVNHPIRPDSDYGTSKAFGEALARQYWELYGIRSICLRIGTVVEDDRPHNARHLKTWLSHRDLVQLVTKSIHSKVGFGIYYGVSHNKGRFWDTSNAEEEIGYSPQDDASKYAHLIGS